ncbi:MAG: carboxypeptidase regulatory-like domain-containing protein [Acidobacteriota bacterium]
MRLAALSVLSTLFAIAQTPEPVYEIYGKIVEPGVGPVAGVGISIDGIGPGLPRIGVITDAQGVFRTRVEKPGRHMLFPQKPGYSLGPFLSPEGLPTAILDAGHPRAELNFEMFRVGQISGRVLDDESREPLKGFEIYLIRRDASSTIPVPEMSMARTDAEGRFSFSNQPPGDYVVSTRPVPSERQSALEVFKPEEAVETETGYAETF